MVAVRDGAVSDVEKEVFHAINDLPEALYPVLWPFQQLGVLVVGPAVAIVAALLRRFRLAAAILLATVAKLALERVVKDIVTRTRPGTSVGGDVELRGDVSRNGPSFVSGHAVLVTALAGSGHALSPGSLEDRPVGARRSRDVHARVRRRAQSARRDLRRRARLGDRRLPQPAVRRSRRTRSLTPSQRQLRTHTARVWSRCTRCQLGEASSSAASVLPGSHTIVSTLVAVEELAPAGLAVGDREVVVDQLGRVHVVAIVDEDTLLGEYSRIT